MLDLDGAVGVAAKFHPPETQARAKRGAERGAEFGGWGRVGWRTNRIPIAERKASLRFAVVYVV